DGEQSGNVNRRPARERCCLVRDPPPVGAHLQHRGTPSYAATDDDGDAPAPDQLAPLALPTLCQITEHRGQRVEPRVDRASESTREPLSHLAVEPWDARRLHRRYCIARSTRRPNRSTDLGRRRRYFFNGVDASQNPVLTAST